MDIMDSAGKITKEILIQYADLQQEIKYLSKRIDRLKNECVKCEAKKQHDVVKASQRTYPYTEKNIHIEGLASINEVFLNSKIKQEIKKLENRYEALLETTNDVLDFIESIDDSHMRMIITYRIIENYSWEEVADAMGGGNTGSGVRQAFHRFIAK
jgi:hypothetical protein